MISTRHIFVVRIWMEQERSPTDDRPIAVLRGSLEQINQEGLHYFTSLEDIASLIEATMDWNQSTVEAASDDE